MKCIFQPFLNLRNLSFITEEKYIQKQFMIENQREKMIDFQFMKYKLKFQVTQLTVKKTTSFIIQFQRTRYIERF